MTSALKATPSPHSVAATIERVLTAIEQRGITLFARIDHGAGAAAAGLPLPAEQVLIFGNPEVGTPLMQADPTIGYELPLRLLIWDADGQTMIGYRPSTDLTRTYAIDAHSDVLARIDSGLDQLVQDSIASV